MNIIIYFKNGKRCHLYNVTNISLLPVANSRENVNYISVVYLNLDTCYYESKSWLASEVKNITLREFET